MLTPETAKIAVIGLGYVGLPLAVALGARWPTTGFDVDEGRVCELAAGHDRTRELTQADLKAAQHLTLTSAPADLADCNTYIVTVPTPIDACKQPDLRFLRRASHTVAQHLAPGDVVIYESTVYPGATEDVCVPILEAVSRLTYNSDFYVGYSPERINPGDTEHRLTKIIKVTSGSTPEAADYVDALYASIIEAGTHKVSSIQVAEAAKFIENTQRDVNIALMNELALIFNRLKLDTQEVLDAARTKWNFLPFRPGLVGGHCIGVDPYYLTRKAESIGYFPQVILSGRRLNDGMGTYVANQVVKAMLARRIQVDGARALVMGLSYKENCRDLRNTRVVDIVSELSDYGIAVDVHDPMVCPRDARMMCGVSLAEAPEPESYNAVVLAVAHDQFIAAGSERARKYGAPGHVFYDLKSVFPPSESDLRL